jgi:SNF2 family DNA or RNA helicase
MPWVWGLTGAPIPNEPTDAYGQCLLVTPTTVPKYFTQFRNMVMEHQSIYVWTPRREALDIVYKAMRPAIRFKRDDCLDLPGEMFQTRDVELSAEQTKHYKEIMRELYTEVQGGKVTAMNEGVKLSKLLQIACGVVYDSTGTPREIDAGSRLETLMELIEQINEKIIIFVPFTAVTGMLARELNKHWNFAVVTGDTPIKERNQIFSDFQNPAIDIDIIAHPACMSHGLTLTEASTIIWYAAIDSNDTYQQANGRITRAGQKYVANIIHLAGSTVERRMFKRLESRQKIQGLLLDMVERKEQ